MLYYLVKRYRLKWLRKLFCKIGWHSDIDGYSMLNLGGKCIVNVRGVENT